VYKRLAGVVGVMAFAGFTAGLLGIGGALIFNPVLLQLGVQPQVIYPTRYPSLKFHGHLVLSAFNCYLLLLCMRLF